MAQLAQNLDLSRAGTTVNRAVVIWLFAMAALVFAMVVLGGVTRLTGSGLSMVDWQPLTGFWPPMSGASDCRRVITLKGLPDRFRDALADFTSAPAAE